MNTLTNDSGSSWIQVFHKDSWSGLVQGQLQKNQGMGLNYLLIAIHEFVLTLSTTKQFSE